MTTTKNRFLYLAAATALGLTLASCSGDAGGDETTDSGAEGEQTTSEQTEESGDQAAEDDGDAAAAGPECLVGTWEMTPEAMEEQVLAQLGGEGEVSVEGTSTMTFDGETVTTDVDNSSTTSITVEGTTVESASTTDGTIVIGYTADEQTITYADVVSAEGTVSVQIGDTSQEMDIAETAGQMANQSLTYTCTDAELTLTSEVEGIELNQTFTRA